MRSFDPDYFPILREVEKRHFWFRSRNDVITGLLERWLPPAPASRATYILDIGCGNGNVLRAIGEWGKRRMVLAGMDPFREGLVNAKSSAAGAWVQGDVMALPFGQRFDAVGLFDVIEHLEDDGQVLEAARRVLRPGGIILITVPAHQSLWSHFDVLACHKRRYEKGQLEERLVAAGFEVQFLSYYMALTFPILFIWRRLARKLASTAVQSGAADLRVYPIANELLFWALTIERHLLLRWGLPFGSSLIAVARRKEGESNP